MELADRIKVLKQHQVYCYQVCLSLLNEQEQSEVAACAVLLELAQIPEFFTADLMWQRAKVRQVAVGAFTAKQASTA